MDRSELASKILQVISDHQPIKAIKIADILLSEFGVSAKRKDVNSVLYSELRTKVTQNKKYQWSVSGSDEVPVKKFKSRGSGNEEEGSGLRSSSILSKISKYYLECISHERDTEVSVYQTDKFGKPDYYQVIELPTLVDNFHEYFEEEDVRSLCSRLQRSRGNQNLYLGYPVYVRPYRNGKHVKIEPLFLFPFQRQEDGQIHSSFSLSEDAPRINHIAFKGYADESGSLFEEMIQLQHELQLDQKNEDLPEIDELVLRLKSLRPQWPWMGEVNAEKLDDTDLAYVEESGIYNCAVLIRGEGSKFTQGLETELANFQEIGSDEEYENSVLYKMIAPQTGGPQEYAESEKIDLIEPIPLNFEQKEAISSVFKNDLTVITGPPGTGKSQVVTGILVNAARQGYKILFTSKNNKAVDVVEKRVNGLTSQPLLLRLGAKELQSTLADGLNSLLSFRPDENIVSEYEKQEENHDFLVRNIENLNLEVQKVIEKRNTVDNLDRKRDRFELIHGSDCLKKVTYANISIIENSIGNLEKAVGKLDLAKRSIFQKMFWGLLNSSRNNFFQSQVVEVISNFRDLGFNDQPSFNSNASLDSVIESLPNIKGLLSDMKAVRDFDLEFEELRKMPRIEDLFRKIRNTYDDLCENDFDLWVNWLQKRALNMTPNDRQVLSEYITILKYIVDANKQNENINKSTWRDYYSLSEKVAYLLPTWAITSLSARGRIPLNAGIFDLVVIDEASQCDLASALPLLYRAKKAVILGDPNQLRHISTLSGNQDIQLLDRFELSDRRVWGYSKNSVYDLAAGLVSNVITLKEHHRSHQDIIQYSNEFFYKGDLRVATKYEKLNRLNSSSIDEPSIKWIDVSGQTKKLRGKGAYNEIEAEAIISYLRQLIHQRGYTGSIGIVTPFRAHANHIQELIAKTPEITSKIAANDILVDTVHKFQGDEKDIIVFSPVIAQGMSTPAKAFLRVQGNLFNVAITRARSHLVVIGDKASCSSSNVPYLEYFVTYVENIQKKAKHKNLSKDDLGVTYPKSVYDPQTVSEYEVDFYPKLIKADLFAIPQYREDKYRLDFALFDGERKLDIEVDGEAYHKDWNGNRVRSDELRDRRLMELGWDVMRFWVYEIRDRPDDCVKKVMSWLAQDS